mgnify:CR=1 FL=1
MSTHNAITLQEVFDNALFGARRQGYVPSRQENGGCMYRDPSGLRCGIGFSIPDELYEPVMDANGGRTVRALTDPHLNFFPSLVAFFSRCKPCALADIQNAHDDLVYAGSNGDGFERDMQCIAQKYKLTFTEVAP